jgi:hypothetical protein
VVEFSVADGVETVAVEFEAMCGIAVGATTEECDPAVFEGTTPGWFVVPAFIPESTEIVFAT